MTPTLLILLVILLLVLAFGGVPANGRGIIGAVITVLIVVLLLRLLGVIA
jgi:hypothetical protein